MPTTVFSIATLLHSRGPTMSWGHTYWSLAPLLEAEVPKLAETERKEVNSHTPAMLSEYEMNACCVSYRLQSN